MMQRLKYSMIGFALGMVVAILVYFAESTTGQISWPLVVSFPVSWAFGGYVVAK